MLWTDRDDRMTPPTQLVGKPEHHHLRAARLVGLEHHRDAQSRHFRVELVGPQGREVGVRPAMRSHRYSGKCNGCSELRAGCGTGVCRDWTRLPQRLAPRPRAYTFIAAIEFAQRVLADRAVHVPTT